MKGENSMSKKWLLMIVGSLLAAMLVTGCATNDDPDPAPQEENMDNNQPGEDGGQNTDTTGNGNDDNDINDEVQNNGNDAGDILDGTNEENNNDLEPNDEEKKDEK